jgi:hypothetical protein
MVKHWQTISWLLCINITVEVGAFYAFAASCGGECVGGLVLFPISFVLLIIDATAVLVFIAKQQPRGIARVMSDAIFIALAFGAIFLGIWSFTFFALPIFVRQNWAALTYFQQPVGLQTVSLPFKGHCVPDGYSADKPEKS